MSGAPELITAAYGRLVGEIPTLERLSLTSQFFWVVVIATTGGLALSFTRARTLEGAGASSLGSVMLYVLVATIGMGMDITAVVERPGLFALVTGEAAGATYAFTGEGIGKAMETGIIAAETIAAARDTLLTDAQARAEYEAHLWELKPRFDLYEKANRVNEHPWLADLVISRAKKSPRILNRMSAVLEERGNPGNLVSLRGILRLFIPIP